MKESYPTNYHKSLSLRLIQINRKDSLISTKIYEYARVRVINSISIFVDTLISNSDIFKYNNLCELALGNNYF